MGKTYNSNLSGTWTNYVTTTVTPFGGTPIRSRQPHNSMGWHDNVFIRTGSNGRDWASRLRHQLLTGFIDAFGSSTLVEEYGSMSRSVQHTGTLTIVTEEYDSPYAGNFFASVPTGNVEQSARNAAARALVANCQKRRQTMILATIGESREAMGTLTGLATDVANRFTKYTFGTVAKLDRINRSFRRAKHRRGRPLSADDLVMLTRVLLKKAGSEWLRFAYGILPLLGELDSASEHAAFAGPQVMMARSKGRRKIAVRGPQVRFSKGTIGAAVINNPQSWTEAIIKHKVRLATKSPIELALHQVGLDPESWIPSLWELAPYSFLVDMFTNIGDIIAARCFWGFNPSVVQETVWREDGQEIVTMDDSKTSPPYRLISESFRKSVVRRKTTTCTRKRLKAPPIPQYEFSYDPSLFQRANLAALAAVKAAKLLNLARASTWASR